MGVWQLQFALLGVFQHAAFGEPVHAPLADEAFLARVLSEEEVENDAHHRYECKHKKPRHSLGRLPMVHQNSHHHADGDDDIKCNYGCVEILHRHTCCYSCCCKAFVLLAGAGCLAAFAPCPACLGVMLTMRALCCSVWFVPLNSPYVKHKNTHCFHNYKTNGTQIRASGSI